MRSFGFDRGRYLIGDGIANRSEHLVRHFHKLCYDAIRPDAALLWLPRASAVRLHHRRRGLGGLRAGGAPDRGQRACACCLIEAGPTDRSWRIAMPSAVGSLLSSDRFNWNYVSDPEPGLDGRRLTHPRGRVLGGSSSINGMVYIRGHARDYDGWAGCGSCAAGATPRCCRTSSARERHLAGRDAYHGASGPLDVFAPDLAASPLAAAFVQAAVEAGYGLSTDVNGERQEGFGRIDRTTTCQRPPRERRTRLSRARRPSGPNLTVLTGSAGAPGDRSSASRARSASSTPWARSLAQAHAERRGHRVGGRDQLAPAAAAVGHRQRGGLSTLGVAPRCTICRRWAPISTIIPTSWSSIAARSPCPSIRRNRGLGKVVAGLRWFAGIDGLAGSNHFEAGGFIRSRAGIEYPDLQLTFMPLAIKPGTVDDVGMHSFQVHIDLMRPKSLGRGEHPLRGSGGGALDSLQLPRATRKTARICAPRCA